MGGGLPCASGHSPGFASPAPSHAPRWLGVAAFSAWPGAGRPCARPSLVHGRNPAPILPPPPRPSPPLPAHRYRERLRGEAKFLRRTAAAASAAGSPAKSGMTAAETLRSMNTGRRWGPAKKMGTWSTASDDIGFGMDEVKFTSPRRGKVSTTAQFHNSGHLAVGGAGDA